MTREKSLIDKPECRAFILKGVRHKKHKQESSIQKEGAMPAQLREALSEAIVTKPVSGTFKEQIIEDEFLSLDDLVPVNHEAAERSLKRLLSEIEELIREKKWEDAVSIFYPVEEKQPELIEYGLDVRLRSKVAFALGHLKRFDEAIKELSLCVQKEPGIFMYHSSLAFSAYNSLFAATNREIFLRGRARADRIELAHRHFRKSQELRPEGVTNFYRQGMLYRKIERKTEKALPLFERAVSNWDRMDEKEKESRHQERKNFVKALYQLASCMLEMDMPAKAQERDSRSRHKTLIRLTKIEYSTGNFVGAMKCAAVAGRFFQEKWGNPYYKGMFWEALCAYRLGHKDRAMELAMELKAHSPHYPKLDLLTILDRRKELAKALAEAKHSLGRERCAAWLALNKPGAEGGFAPMDIANPVSAYFFLSDDAQDEISGGKKKNMKCQSCGHGFAGESYDSCPECFSLDTEEIADEKDDGYW